LLRVEASTTISDAEWCVMLNKTVSATSYSLHVLIAYVAPLMTKGIGNINWQKMRMWKRSKRSNKRIFPCNQWRRVWPVPSGFNELRDVAVMAWKRSMRGRFPTPPSSAESKSFPSRVAFFGTRLEGRLRQLPVFLRCPNPIPTHRKKSPNVFSIT
jgi:hypothetical protein